MDQPTPPQKGPTPRHQQEYDNPHYHDDDAFEAPADDVNQQRATPRKEGRRIPPPPRRRYED